MIRNYVISGATATSGKILSQRLAQDKNNKVILLSRSKSPELEKLAENENVKYFSGIDLTKFETEKSVISEIDNFFDSEFNFVHLAGNFWWHLPFEQVSTDEAADMMNSQYITMYSVCRSIIPLMVKNGGGRILAIGDNAVDYAYPNMSAFSAAKSAVNTFVKCIGHEFADRGIAANVLEISSLAGPQNKENNPNVDYECYMTLQDFSENIIRVFELPKQINCTIIKAYEFNNEFYNKGYFQRLGEKLGE
ncbi:MAG: SDR family oxidoreductase [Rickettsiales bacterium]|jgi:NAD(P)-dependent dehydrogenase (short-subunit alcohol dehydrogenase family)|nr:SDR family oxidoreductase [Rickettsiales bacterium]